MTRDEQIELLARALCDWSISTRHWGYNIECAAAF